MTDFKLDPSQRAAVDLVCTEAFACIVGGPGCGKTTSLRVALDRMDAAGETYKLAAPTGKAAKRMSEATGRPAGTIHRLLEWSRGYFQRDADNPIEADAVVIDESSMLDVNLACDLFDACAPNTRVVLVGDQNQLPSVGPGRVLGDLVDSGICPVAQLTTVHRAAAQSWICRNAPRVLSGEPLELEAFDDFRFFEVDSAADAAAAVRRVVTSSEFAGAQVLTPQRTSACGVTALNTQLQAELNPDRGGGSWTIGERVLRVGDRVIQTSNNYSIEVFNGEVGVVRAADSVLVVDFGDRAVNYTKEHALALELAYALTVHKSQGSEFPWAVVLVHSAHTYMLTRQLFYTAITRAKQGVVLVGDRKGLEVATGEKTPPKRNTALVKLMRDQLGGAA